MKRSQYALQVEHASAGSLADRCEGRRMAEPQARRLFAQLLDGLEYCHAQGVFHRDLRAEHVLLSGRCSSKAPHPQTAAGNANARCLPGLQTPSRRGERCVGTSQAMQPSVSHMLHMHICRMMTCLSALQRI